MGVRVSRLPDTLDKVRNLEGSKYPGSKWKDLKLLKSEKRNKGVYHREGYDRDTMESYRKNGKIYRSIVKKYGSIV